jgi:hypothetical protein
LTSEREADEDEAPVRSQVTSKPSRRRLGEEDEDDAVEERPRTRRGRSDPEDEDEEEGPQSRRQSRKKARGNPALLWGLLLGGAVLLVAGGVTLFLILNHARREVWTIPVEQQDRLADYDSFGRGYRIRPPQGWTKGIASGPEGYTGYAWRSQRPDGWWAEVMMVSTILPPQEADRHTPETALQSLLNAIKKQHQNLTPTTTEQGEINGLPFVRARWSGTTIADRFGTSKRIHGFCYVCLQGRELIQITGQNVEPGHEAPLALAEASALSFQKAPEQR